MLKNQVAGIEWADEIDQDLKENMSKVPVVEIIPDNFFNYNAVHEKTIGALNDSNKPVIIHSVALSLLSIESFKKDYFNKILDLSKRIKNVITFSDHLCMTELANEDIGQLTSAPYNRDTLKVVVDKINRIQDITGMPFAIENISHPFYIPNQEYSETEFINKMIEKTGCKLLLDINNLYTNEVNFNIDAKKWLSEIDYSTIDSIHLAGGFMDDDGILQDGHCAKVPPQVWDLFDYTIENAKRPITSIIERTGNNAKEGITPILQDMYRAQKTLNEVY